MKYFLAARVETVLSIVKFGRMTDRLPPWWADGRTLIFYLEPDKTAISSSTTPNQTFLLEVELPSVDSEPLLTLVRSLETDEHHIEAIQINPEWVQSIWINSQVAEKLVYRLFNDQIPIPVIRHPEIFPSKTPLVKHRPFTEDFSEHQLPQRLVQYKRQGDLLGSQCQTLINTVNCVGVMGKGIALAFKLQYPAMFAEYKVLCERGEVKIGQPYLYRHSPTRWILNFPTKKHWKAPSQIDYIESGLRYLVDHLKEWDITSLAIPPLGCGNGGLNWNEVHPLIEKYIEGLHIPIEIYLPFKATPMLKSKPISTFFKSTKKSSSEVEEESPPLKRSRQDQSQSKFVKRP